MTRPALPCLSLMVLTACAMTASAFQDTAPFDYVEGTAYHILPETHNNESGYFSLNEGLDGSIYIGTTKYGDNAYLVEFDPRRQSQRIVLDTNAVCGLDARGYAAQAKLHTRNFVGRSGRIYVGSKQGYRMDETDTADYPGGYVMYYDPRTGKAKCLGMPMAGQGVIDVTADEDRGITYVVTCEDQHWMLGSSEGTDYRELGPMLTPYATTLVAADGCGYAITHDFQLARYDPETKKIGIRPIMLNGKSWKRENSQAIPTWFLSADRRRAWLILLNDATLLELDLVSGGAQATMISHGVMIEGNNPDCRCGMALGGDGNIYAVIRIDNETGFGSGYLHHLVRFDTVEKTMEKLGVLKVSNPEFFDWNRKGADDKPRKWTHGFHRLPDETLTPLHAHMGLIATRDNTIYITVIYPFTLLKIDQFRVAQPASPARQRLNGLTSVIDAVDGEIDRYSRTAETVADRHIKGGVIGFPFVQQCLVQDLWGRSGGMVHIGFERVWKEHRDESERAQDTAIVGYDRPAGQNELAELQKLKQRGVYLIGFGRRSLPGVESIASLCDEWFEAPLDLLDYDPDWHDIAGANAIGGWTLIAELVAALTRQGKMPTMWKSYSFDDGREWGDRYFRKQQFHTDLEVPPVGPGVLARRFLRQIRYPVDRLKMQTDELRRVAQTLRETIKAKQKVYVAWQGHMPMIYVGKSNRDQWGVAGELHPFLESQVKRFDEQVPDQSQILALGYHGHDPIERQLWQRKRLQVIHSSGDHPDPQWRQYSWMQHHIDLGFAFGDACVSLEGYPIRLFAPSGIAQIAAYNAILAELESAD